MEQDLFSILGATVGLFLGGLLVKIRSNQTYRDPKLNPVLSGTSLNYSQPVNALTVI
jgi:hypothetical protein